MVPRIGDSALSGIVGALSGALDASAGRPAGHAARSCVIGMRLAAELGLDAAARSDLFYALLLKDAGGSATDTRDGPAAAGSPRRLRALSRRLSGGERPRGLPALPSSRRRELPAADGSVRARARCEHGAEIARMLCLGAGTAAALGALAERWDGGGRPAGLAGEEIPLAARVVCLAQTVEIAHAAGGIKAAWAVARRRRGRALDPALVDALGALRRDRAFWAALAAADVSAWEPPERRLTAGDERLDRIAEAFARLVDARSRFTARHSERVAELAAGTAAVLGFGPLALRELRRAALLHDLGKLAIPSRILDAPGPLTEELATVREHPLRSLRILERAPGFASTAWIAATHHERLDASGYPFGLGADKLTRSMRVLAVADVYEALTAARPHRPALPRAAAFDVLWTQAPARLDAAALAALETFVAGGAGASATAGREARLAA